MTGETFQECIEKYFGELLAAKGFAMVSDETNAAAFGNRSVVYTSSMLAVRFTRDRGEAFVDVSATGRSDWYMLPRVLEFLRLDRESNYWSADEAALRREGTMLAHHLDQIAALFRGGNVPEKLSEFSAKKAEAHYKNLGLRKLPEREVHEVFIRETLEAFAYLKADFGFEHSATTVVAYEAMVIFRKADRVAVTVACDAGALPWVMLTGNVGSGRKYRSEELPLDVVLAARCPPEQIRLTVGFPVDEEAVVTAVRHYAGALRHCAADVLEGDVSVFGQMKTLVDAEHGRRTKQLKREERAAKKRQR